MKRSFLRLIVTSVLVAWLLGFVLVVGYARSREWNEDRVQHDGVFLFHRLIDETPVADRAERLRELQRHTNVPLQLLTREEVERRLGHQLAPGANAPLYQTPHEHWHFVALSDGEMALAAGPIHPAVPFGAVPIGGFIAIFGLPLIAAFIALRVQRELIKVERASQALAEGELSARVDNPHGPSRELAAEFNAMAERIERLVRSRDELVQAVSHELGSPLSRLRFHMELLERPDAERAERLQAMNRELDALDELVSELLGYVQSDDLQLDCEDFDPRPGLEDLAELAVLDAHEDTGVTVDTNFANVELHADRRLFLRAVENLLRNAVRHAEANVRLHLTEDDDGMHVAVHDDGPGIPRALRDKVATPFFRLSAERDRRTGGVGLGLAIVHRIIQRHGGRLRIGDSPLGGAVVTTVWPRAAPRRA